MIFPQVITWSEFAILSHRHISFHPTERKVTSSVRILRNNMTGSLHRRLCSSLPTHLVRVWHVLFLIMFNRRWTIGPDHEIWTHTPFGTGTWSQRVCLFRHVRNITHDQCRISHRIPHISRPIGHGMFISNHVKSRRFISIHRIP